MSLSCRVHGRLSILCDHKKNETRLSCWYVPSWQLHNTESVTSNTETRFCELNWKCTTTMANTRHSMQRQDFTIRLSENAQFTSELYEIPHMCYRAKFRRCRSNHLGVGRGRKNLGSRGPVSLESGRRNMLLPCVTTPNLVILRQAIRT